MNLFIKASRRIYTAITRSIVPLVFLVGLTLPAPSLAYESPVALANSLVTSFLTQTDLSVDFTASADEEVETADHGYLRAGSVVSMATPITERAKWPEPKIVKRGGSGLILEGEASYYSRAGCLGCNPLFIMANGQALDDAALTMAIGANLRHLVGYQARVTSLATGKSVTVRITDTGGFYAEKYGRRVADLTIATKQAIGMVGGVGQVRVEVL